MEEENVNDSFDTSQFYKILKGQLIKIVGDFMNELDISFDYINKDSIKAIKKKLKSMSENDIKFKKFYSELYNILKTHNDKGSLYLGEKVKTKDFEFLNELNIFGILFNNFKEENKNTKKTIVNYLKEFYIICNFLMYSGDGNLKSTETLFNDIKNMVNDLSKQHQPLQEKRKGKGNLPDTPDTRNLPDTGNLPDIPDISSMLNNMQGLPDLSSMLPGMDNTFMSLMQNKDIMNIARELSTEMKSQEIDPMSIMTSLMSGNLNDGKIGNLINSITTKLTQKIDNGDIDKDSLETHANSFMQNLSSNKELMSLAQNLGNNISMNDGSNMNGNLI